MRPNINWIRLGEAASYYEKQGYQQIEVPWLVSPLADDATRPEGKAPFDVSGRGRLIGSGEQGFIQMILEGQLSPGRYFTITPCFRDEIEDQYHQTDFVKLELIGVSESDPFATLNQMVWTAWGFFRKYLNSVKQIQTKEGIDLVYLGMEQERWNQEHALSKCGPEMELGSYGIRKSPNGILYVFGTGLAEPRLSLAKTS